MSQFLFSLLGWKSNLWILRIVKQNHVYLFKTKNYIYKQKMFLLLLKLETKEMCELFAKQLVSFSFFIKFFCLIKKSLVLNVAILFRQDNFVI